MKVILIDDEGDARLMLRQYLEEFPGLTIVDECSNGLEAVTAIERHEPDLVFLDIQMPGMSGFQVLQNIVHIPQVIFSTAYDRYALKAFDHNAVDYLLKPYTRDRFAQAVNKLLLSSPSRNLHQIRALADNLQKEQTQYLDRLLVEQGNRMIALQAHEIIWIEANGDYANLHTGQKSFLSSLGLGELENRLNPAQFLRIHRSAIIGLAHILEVRKDPSGYYMDLTNGKRHKVSRSYQEALKKWMV
ncbi:MAG: response regulator transcription factor [Lewinellaceae bacterium]|nr:response regulator transcription factor [Saprospiraceae bacterium]MCB9341871.1 response regulator transcription factor [Lewinellaceae bacterium]